MHYGLLLAITAAAALAAVLSNRLIERIKIPMPLLMLAGIPAWSDLRRITRGPGNAERTVSVRLFGCVRTR